MSTDASEGIHGQLLEYHAPRDGGHLVGFSLNLVGFHGIWSDFVEFEFGRISWIWWDFIKFDWISGLTSASNRALDGSLK